MRFLDSLRSLGMTISAVVSILLLAGCCNCVYTVTVTNPTDADRHPEMVELDLQDLGLTEGESFIVKNESGDEIPYQITYDDKVIFQVTLKAGQEQTYKICKGTPSEYENLVFGKHYAEKDDDFAWENDKVGFRVYGHKLDVASGYDLFCKRGTHLPVLEQLYANEVYSSDAWKRYYELEAVSAEEAFRFKMDTLSFHVDRGYGMDVYAVGPTLGAGIAALMDNEVISYPYCYSSYEILDNGPIRFTVKFTFRPIACGEDKEVLETRIITLDAGSHLNRTSVSFANLTSPKEIVAGIILREDGGQWAADAEKGYISYPAPTQNHDTRKVVDNGIIYVGHVYPNDLKTAQESHGHILTRSDYTPESEFVYYWGFGWDHSDILTHEQWNEYLETYALMVRNPLTITRNN